jgi:hypothetical protein
MGVGAVAKRLVSGLAAAAQDHRVGVRDLAAVDIGEEYRPGDVVGAIRDGPVALRDPQSAGFGGRTWQAIYLGR